MQVIKPQKVMIENLREIKIEELEDEENIEKILIVDSILQEKELYNSKIEKSVFRKVEIINGKILILLPIIEY